MSYRPNPLFWSLYVGSFARVRVRMSWLFPVVLLYFGFQFGLALGTTLWAILLISVLTVIGSLISDLLLVWIDPRIRLEGR